MVTIKSNARIATFIKEIEESEASHISEKELDAYLKSQSDIQYKKLISSHQGLVNHKKSYFNRFKKQLRKTYTPAFELFEIFIELYRESGDFHRIENIERAELESNYLFKVLLLMYARSCQIGQEIFTLMENGYPDGAYARWRTLYETTVFAKLINDEGLETATRYLEYANIENFAEAKYYRDLVEKYAFPGIDESDYLELEQEYERLISKYGKEFSKNYGWAAHFLKPKERNIYEMSIKAGLEFESGYYKLACNNVHAGSKGHSSRIASIEGIATLAGASNFGQADVGIITVHSLYRIAELYFAQYASPRILVILNILSRLVEKIQEELSECQDQVLKHTGKPF